MWDYESGDWYHATHTRQRHPITSISSIFGAWHTHLHSFTTQFTSNSFQFNNLRDFYIITGVRGPRRHFFPSTPDVSPSRRCAILRPLRSEAVKWHIQPAFAASTAVSAFPLSLRWRSLSLQEPLSTSWPATPIACSPSFWSFQNAASLRPSTLRTINR